MRRVSRGLLAAGLSAIPLLFTGCDVPVDFWQEQSVSVNYSDTVTTISKEEDVDISQNSALAGKASLLKNVEIPEVWINVDKIYTEDGENGPANKATRVSGTMTITDPSDSNWAPLVFSYEKTEEDDNSVPIAEGGKIDLTPKQEDIDRLQALIQSKGKFHVKYSGTIDAVPAHFDLTGKIHVIASVGT